MGFKKPTPILDREDDYRKRRLDRIISPERHDAFAMGRLHHFTAHVFHTLHYTTLHLYYTCTKLHYTCTLHKLHDTCIAHCKVLFHWAHVSFLTVQVPQLLSGP